MHECDIGDAYPRRLTAMAEKEAPLLAVNIYMKPGIDPIVERLRCRHIERRERNLDIPMLDARRRQSALDVPRRGALSADRHGACGTLRCCGVSELFRAHETHVARRI